MAGRRRAVSAACLVAAFCAAGAAASQEFDADDWSGPYAGLSAAYAFGSADSSFHLIQGGGAGTISPYSPSSYHPSRSGFFGGAQLGYNFVSGRVLFGPEIDFSLGRAFARSWLTGVSSASGRAILSTQKSAIDSLGSLRGRIGILVDPSLLAYATGGLAFGSVANHTRLAIADGALYNGVRAQNRVGWTLGAGAEWALAEGWRTRLEYLYFDLGRVTANGYQQDLGGYHAQSDLAAAGSLVRVGFDYAFGGRGRAVAPELPAALSALEYELGGRYWYSSGSTRFNLRNQLIDAGVSRLSFADLKAHAGELFGRIGLPNSLFIKFTGGLGAITGGSLADEDYVPAGLRYSKTMSDQRSGGLSYATVDLGHPLVQGDGFRLSPFVGYAYLHEQLNAYGCTQVGNNGGICPPGQVSSDALVISETYDWHAARVGLAGEAALPWRGMTVALDAAWLPYGKMYGADSHWLRLNTGDSGSLSAALPLNATTHGLQVEAVARVALTDAATLGLGGRYWYMAGHGSTTFRSTYFPDVSQPITQSTRRYGVFTELRARF